MAQRYASPGGSGPEPCSQGSPCSLTAAVNNAVGGEVIVLPGAYDIGTASLLLDDATLNVHGADGQSRPTIRGAPNAAPLVSITGVGATMSHLGLRQEGNGGVPSLSVAVNATVASTLSDLIITNTAATSTAARLANLVTAQKQRGARDERRRHHRLQRCRGADTAQRHRLGRRRGHCG